MSQQPRTFRCNVIVYDDFKAREVRNTLNNIIAGCALILGLGVFAFLILGL